MRRPSRAGLAALATILVACGSVTGGNPAGSGPTASQRLELDLALEDEVQAATSALTVARPGVPPSFGSPAGCPTVSNTADGDGDGIPTDAVWTYSAPACQVTIGGGNWLVTGSVRVQDPSAGNATSYGLTFTNLAWSFGDTAQTRTYLATRNGTRARTGTTDSVSLATAMTVVRQRPNRANTTVTLNTTTTFLAATPGSVVAGQPVPDGALAVSGSFEWQRSTEHWSLGVTTLQALVYDASCAGTVHRFTSGRIALGGSVNGQAGVLILTWSGCGTPPARLWVPGA